MLEHGECNEAGRQRREADEAQLAVGELGQLAERVAPDARRDQRQHALEHEDERKRSPEQVGGQGVGERKEFTSAAAAAPRGPTRIA